MADKDEDKATKKDAKPATDNRPRVICSLPNASGNISGVKFVDVIVDDAADAVPVHVSERIDQEQADRFCQVDGYAMFVNTAPAVQAKIDAALVEAAKVAAPGTDRAELDKRDLTITELRRANLAMAADLKAERQRGETLAAENLKMAGELRLLKGAGLRQTMPPVGDAPQASA